MKYIKKESTHWFILSPRPRERVIIPSKYPEELVEYFLLKFHIKEGAWIIDPFVGIGSTNIACAELNYKCVGIDIQELYVEFGKRRLEEWCIEYGKNINKLENYLVVADSSNLEKELKAWFKNRGLKLPTFKMCITSPSYWKILEKPGKEFIEKCKSMQIPSKYYDHPRDLAKIKEYEKYLDTNVKIFGQIFNIMDKNSFLIVILKNLKNNKLAWDFAIKLIEETNWKFYDEYLWCQDDVPIQPLSPGIYWNSTISHHYCLAFIKE